MIVRGRRIVGSEVGEPRPIAYMRRGRTRRSGRRKPRTGWLIAAAVLLSLFGFWTVGEAAEAVKLAGL